MTLPEGLTYVRGFLTEAEERDVLAVVAAFELHPYVLHGTPSRRLVRSFGLEWLRERCAMLMGREPELVDLLLTIPRLEGRGFQPSPAGVPVSRPTAPEGSPGV